MTLVRTDPERDARTMTRRSVLRRSGALRVLAALVLVVGSIALGAEPTQAGLAQPPTAALTVTPDTGLTDFVPVQVSGTGFDGESLLEGYQCRGGAVDEFDCDPSNAYFVDVAPDGTIDYEFYVDARIYLQGGEEVDCRTDPAGCVIGVGFLVDAGDWPQAPIAFDPDAPLRPEVTATVTPDQDLTDGQVVTVAGEHLSFREEAFAYVCVDEPGEPGERCDIDRLARGVPDADGTLELDLAVWSSFNAPLGGPRTCGPQGDACVVLVNWSFFGNPDRRAAVPISFAVAPPTTTTTVPTTLPPAQPPPAPAAAAVTGQPDFTG